MCVFGISKQTLKLFWRGLFWDAYNKEEGMGVGGKNTLHPQNLPHILQWRNLAQLYLTWRRSKKYINHVTHLLSSASISIFSLQISNFHYIRKYRYTSNFNTWFLILFTFFESLKVFWTNILIITSILEGFDQKKTIFWGVFLVQVQ